MKWSIFLVLSLFLGSCNKDIKTRSDNSLLLKQKDKTHNLFQSSDDFTWSEEDKSFVLPAINNDAALRFLSTAIKGDFLLDVMLLPTVQDIGTYGLLIANDKEGASPIAAIQVQNGKVAYAPAMQNLGNGMDVKTRYLRLERKEKVLTAYYAENNGSFKPIARQQISATDTIYGGIFAKATSQSLHFSNLRLSLMNNKDTSIISRLEIYELPTGKRSIVLEKSTHFEAPNWHSDSNYFIVNSHGLLYSVPTNGSDWKPINTGQLKNCNNDHGITPDGKTLIISNNDSLGSRIYTLPIEGSDTATLVTPNAPSYWHGIHPNGERIAYVAKRNRRYLNIFTSKLDGSDEKRISFTVGLDDGPDYASDSISIYFNSTKSGDMKIWRMDTNGKNKRQLTFDSYQDWFPHPSPDGTKLVFLSYLPNVPPLSHPAAQKVMLRMLDLTEENPTPTILTHLFGGQGTINVPSWSPDSQRFAFVSYSYE